MGFSTGRNEKRVKEMVKLVLKRHGVWYTMPHQRGLSQNGVPDILACCRGSFIAIECKSGSNTVTPRQRYQLDAIMAAGGVVFVINESNIEVLEGFFHHLLEAGL